MTLTVRDSSGRIVFELSAESGQPAVTVSRYLATGTYTCEYSYHAVAGQTAAAVIYHLSMLQLSDDVGPYATTTTSPSTGPSTTAKYTYDISYIRTSSTISMTGYWYFF